MNMSHAKALSRKGRRKENAAELLCAFLCAFAPLREKLLFVVVITALIWSSPRSNAQNQEYLEFNIPDFKLRLSKASQTVAALEPKSAAGFDFTPSDRLDKRAGNGYHHLGDLT